MGGGGHIFQLDEDVAAEITKTCTKTAEPGPGASIAGRSFSGNPPYDLPIIHKLVIQYIPQVHMDDNQATYEEFDKACRGKAPSFANSIVAGTMRRRKQ